MHMSVEFRFVEFRVSGGLLWDYDILPETELHWRRGVWLYKGCEGRMQNGKEDNAAYRHHNDTKGISG